MVGKSKNRRRTAEHFKKFSQLLQFLINVNSVVLHRKEMKIATFWSIAAGQLCHFSYWLTAGISLFPSGFPIPCKNCQEAFKEPLGISLRLSYTLLAVPRGYSTTFQRISQQLSAKTWQLPSFFSEGPHFC
jgi:hypothetical protein